MCSLAGSNKELASLTPVRSRRAGRAAVGLLEHSVPDQHGTGGAAAAHGCMAGVWMGLIAGLPGLTYCNRQFAVECTRPPWKPSWHAHRPPTQPNLTQPAWQALWETGTRNLARLGCSCCVAGTAADEQEPGGRAGEQQKGERVDDDTAGGGNVDDLVQGDVPAAAPPPRLAALHRALSLGMRGPAAVKAALPEAAVAAPAAVVRGAVAVPTSAVRGAVDLERRVGLSVLGAAFLVLWAPTQALIIYLVVRTSMGDGKCSHVCTLLMALWVHCSH